MSEAETETELYPGQEDELSIEELAKTEVNARLTPKDKLSMFTDMVRIRAFEARSLRAYQQGKMGGFLHLYEGQEAVAVGTVGLMGKDDHVITAYRDHGHALAVGMSMNECMAEMFGKATGCSKGKGGSMHFFAPDKNYWGGHGIVGGQVPLGTGLAFALKYKGKKGCCLTFMGDGAVNQGAVHEAFNLAGLWDLPVVFVIENNKYSMGTSQARSSAYEQFLAKRGEGYGMEWGIVNGNNLYDVREKTAQAMKKAHEESKPTILEMFTYRYRGHSVADANAEKYRDKSEIQDYKTQRDPITLFREILKNEGHITDAKAKNIEKAARAEAEKAFEFADKSPFPNPEAILEDTYWSLDNKGSNEEIDELNQGRVIFEDGGIFDKD
ncbi:pyruvate dehydrogenase (acetyl-transferring) E1 component subunit alpha [Rubellicoccus peritrichatus]|uniref:Pyruvate dehydrogenase E1 component subunit alpha n=1 Tax=Rubellicoccus peritrichatus TaxID=3080537 RepID=A0AAQ3LBU6_9BACT|nr:pyruvate dehydrogenase (acetyl-transferring) E1 component subunit alpha [Puniceicoccus sp. CR14]WOO42417.1 pyruvate dehydrogenase (acetyl-transferring) E1 component subunit alpha [Puniceicoccus sp. CR14]